MIDVGLTQIAQIVGASAPSTDVTVTGRVTQDSREVEAGSLFIAMAGDHVDGHDFIGAAAEAGAVAALAERAVDAPIPVLVVANPIDAVSALATWLVETLRAEGAPDFGVVALTGSQGKTSVKDLIAHVLATDGPTIAPRGSFNNELGVPLTILRADRTTRHLVLEMGARGVGHIAHLCRIARPDVAGVLNVGSAHLGEFGSVEAIARGKSEIIAALPPAGVAVINVDDVRVAAMRDLVAAPSAGVIGFGTSADADVRVGSVGLDEAGRATFTLDIDGTSHDARVPQLGVHHAINAAAAAAFALARGLDATDIVAALATATSASPMRMEPVVGPHGSLIINDAYNANPDSMAAALASLADLARVLSGPRTTIAVVGEMLELGESSERAHAAVGRRASELGIDHVLAVGDGARPVVDGADARAHWVPDITSAVSWLEARLHADTVVLVKASRGERLERIIDALVR